jgi:multidrug transporter EmrE-like cation transporter
MFNNLLINYHLPVKYSLAIANNVNPVMIYTPDKPDIILLSSIILETFSTICMKKTLTNKIWFIPVYSGYITSFYMFPKTLTKYSLSGAYMLWSGIGIILTTFLDNIIYKELITVRKIWGSIIIILGMKLIN